MQELLRVLLDSLEKEFHGTPFATLVNDLYQGDLSSTIKCKACGHESSIHVRKQTVLCELLCSTPRFFFRLYSFMAVSP